MEKTVKASYRDNIKITFTVTACRTGFAGDKSPVVTVVGNIVVGCKTRRRLAGYLVYLQVPRRQDSFCHIFQSGSQPVGTKATTMGI